jgi:hypothetical protein
MENIFTNRKLKTMKTKIKLTSYLLLLVLNILLTQTFAQGQPEPNMQGNKGEKIEALRIAFISQELNLNPQEAQKFWPVYNQYRGDLKTLHQNFKMDANGQMDATQQLDFEQKKLDLKKKYKGQFEGALGKDKVNQLYNLEHKFHEKLKDMREQRQQQKGNGGQGGLRPGGGNGGGRPFGPK